MRFFAGLGTCLMLIAAASCVAFAVFMMLDIGAPAQARVVPNAAPVWSASVAVSENSAPEETAYIPAPTAEPVTTPEPVYEPVSEPTIEPAVWIPTAPLLDEIADMYAEYVHIGLPEEEEALFSPAPTLTTNSPALPIPLEYTELTFYIHANADLYAEFARERPDLDIEAVIWKVNSNVHVPFYSEIRVNNQTNPLFVTPTYRLPYGFTPAELVPVNHAACHLLAVPQAVDAFMLLRASASAAGFNLSVTSAYRTSERQSQLWINGGRRDGRVARPHHSEHQTGRALDLWGPQGLLDAGGPSPTGRWVAANVQFYGFIVRYRAETTHITGYIHEPWHITYVGTEISMYMYENNILSLEEFVGRNPGAALPF